VERAQSKMNPQIKDAHHSNGERPKNCLSWIEDTSILPYLATLSSRELNVFKFKRIASKILTKRLTDLEVEGGKSC